MCYNVYMNTITQKIYVACAICGTEVYKRPSQVLKNKTGFFFCSSEHQTQAVVSGLIKVGRAKGEKTAPTAGAGRTFSCLSCGTTHRETHKKKTFCDEYCRSTYIASLTEKTCNKCNKTLPISNFWKAKTTADRHHNACKDCEAERWKTWYAEDTNFKRLKNSIRNKEYSQTDKGQENELRKKLRLYGITLEDYIQLLVRCGGLCEICHENEAYAIDHDHTTGEVRGLLCNTCNLALGAFKDDKNLMSAAILYLDTYGAE